MQGNAESDKAGCSRSERFVSCLCCHEEEEWRRVVDIQRSHTSWEYRHRLMQSLAYSFDDIYAVVSNEEGSFDFAWAPEYGGG